MTGATNIVAITVSVNYDDVLGIILPQNAKFFKKWYIITEESDTKTRDLVTAAATSQPHIELLYYNFKQPDAPFNKGGGLREAQLHVLRTHGEVPVLILDSDIYLPDEFGTLYNSLTLQRDKLYSIIRRVDYETYTDFKVRLNGVVHICSADFIGCFQLFIQTADKLYESYKDCGQCDLIFRNLFLKERAETNISGIYGKNTMLDDFKRYQFYLSHNCVYIQLEVAHLGAEVVNWSGRVARRFIE